MSSLAILFAAENASTLRMLCDTLNVQSPGASVTRWVIIGRSCDGFNRRNCADAYEFLEWAADREYSLTLRGLIVEITNYSTPALLGKLNNIASSIASVPAAPVIAAPPPPPVVPAPPQQPKDAVIPDNDDGVACVICLVNSRQYVFTPCGHLVTCEACHNTVQQCPICRSKIETRIKTFLS